MRTAVLALLALAPTLARAQSLPTNQRLYDTTTSMPEVRSSRLAKSGARRKLASRGPAGTPGVQFFLGFARG